MLPQPGPGRLKVFTHILIRWTGQKGNDPVSPSCRVSALWESWWPFGFCLSWSTGKIQVLTPWRAIWHTFFYLEPDGAPLLEHAASWRHNTTSYRPETQQIHDSLSQGSSAHSEGVKTLSLLGSAEFHIRQVCQHHSFKNVQLELNAAA